ncbi:MAG: ABC exporter membrane fusion protein [Cyanobacteria bacterium P01_E01_bin.6]
MNADTFSHSDSSFRLSRRWVGLLGAALLGVTGMTMWSLWQLRIAQQSSAQPDTSLTSEISTVSALGRLEPDGEMINLTAPTSTQENRIDQLLVQEGEYVEAGQIVAILDSHDRLKAALQRAEEQVRVAQAQLAQVEAGAKTGELQAQRAEIARIEADQLGSVNTQSATVARLEAEVENARIEYERYASLYQEGAVSSSERDAKQLTYATAQRQLEESQAALVRIETTSQEQVSQARATLDQLAEVRPVDVAIADAEVRSARASVAEATANLEQVYVRSPYAGQIIEIHTRPGETVDTEGIVTLGQTQQMMVVADVYQSDVPNIQVGQSVTVTSSAVTESLQGTVERIGLQVQRQEVVNEDPAINIDAKVVEVHIRLDAASSGRVAGLSNLQVTATIQTL